MTVLVIARNTLSEAIRKKILWVFLLVALALLVFSVSFSAFSMREELTIIKSFGLGIIAISGIFMAIVLGINLISTEIERKTIYTILSKPVRRYEFLLGKFLGALATIFVNLLMMSVVFMILVTWRNGWHPEFALLKGILMIFFQFYLLTSVALLFSAFTTPLVNFFLTSAVYIVGSMSDITLSMSTSEDKPMIVRYIYWAIHNVTPKFANFFTQNPLIHPEVHIVKESVYYTQCIIYAIIYSAIMLIIAILAFDRRDM